MRASEGRTTLKTAKRKHREQAQLSDEQIVATALELVRHEGAERLSMRKLARELGVTPMAIYYYVPNKDALFERLSDAVLARIPRPEPSGSAWRDELAAYVLRGWQLFLEYPGLSNQLVRRPPSAESDALSRYAVSILVAAGFERSTAALAITSYHAFIVGVIGLQAQLEQRPRRKRRASESTSYLQQLDLRVLVDFGIDTLLTGLDEQLRAAKRKPASKTKRAPNRLNAQRTH